MARGKSMRAIGYRLVNGGRLPGLIKRPERRCAPRGTALEVVRREEVDQLGCLFRELWVDIIAHSTWDSVG